jgi:hypothetical protein
VGAVCPAVLRRQQGDGVWQGNVLSRLGFEQGVGVGGAHTMTVKLKQMKRQLAKRASRAYKKMRLKMKSLKRKLHWAEEKRSGPSYIKACNQPTQQ